MDKAVGRRLAAGYLRFKLKDLEFLCNQRMQLSSDSILNSHLSGEQRGCWSPGEFIPSEKARTP